MCLLFLIGITGLYARQVEEAGRLGLAGFLLLILSWWIQTGFVFTELFILPVLATAAPPFVDSFVGIVNQHPGDMDIGALPTVYNVGAGITYLLGGLLFGIATVRARVLPRWPAGLLAVAAALTPFAALLPHAIQRYAAVPMGLAGLAGLYALGGASGACRGGHPWSRKPAAWPYRSRRIARLRREAWPMTGRRRG